MHDVMHHVMHDVMHGVLHYAMHGLMHLAPEVGVLEVEGLLRAVLRHEARLGQRGARVSLGQRGVRVGSLEQRGTAARVNTNRCLGQHGAATGVTWGCKFEPARLHRPATAHAAWPGPAHTAALGRKGSQRGSYGAAACANTGSREAAVWAGRAAASSVSSFCPAACLREGALAQALLLGGRAPLEDLLDRLKGEPARHSGGEGYNAWGLRAARSGYPGCLGIGHRAIGYSIGFGHYAFGRVKAGSRAALAGLQAALVDWLAGCVWAWGIGLLARRHRARA